MSLAWKYEGEIAVMLHRGVASKWVLRAETRSWIWETGNLGSRVFSGVRTGRVGGGVDLAEVGLIVPFL